MSVEGCDGWAKRGDKQTFGWIVHPQQSVAGRKITIRALSDGTYEVRFYRTWTGEFLAQPDGRMPNGRNHHHVPQWKQDDNAKPPVEYADHDIAFLPAPVVPAGRGANGPQ